MISALSKNFEIRALDPANLSHIMELQNIIIDDLPPGREYDISHRTSEEFKKRMTFLGKMFGVFHKQSDQLVAYSTLALPTKDWPVADMAIDSSMSPCSPELLAVSQNSVVHPAYRGKSLHLHLLRAKLDLCAKLSRRHVIGQVLNHNVRSLKGLLKAGFHIACASITPLRQCKALNVHKDLKNPKPFCEPKSVLYLDPVADFELLKVFLEDGYIGLEIFKTDILTPTSEGYLLKIAKTSDESENRSGRMRNPRRSSPPVNRA